MNAGQQRPNDLALAVGLAVWVVVFLLVLVASR